MKFMSRSSRSKEEKAAARIQAGFRGYAARKVLKLQENSPTLRKKASTY